MYIFYYNSCLQCIMYYCSKSEYYKNECKQTVGKFSLEDSDNLFKEMVANNPEKLNNSRRAKRARNRKELREQHRKRKLESDASK